MYFGNETYRFSAYFVYAQKKKEKCAIFQSWSIVITIYKPKTFTVLIYIKKYAYKWGKTVLKFNLSNNLWPKALITYSIPLHSTHWEIIVEISLELSACGGITQNNFNNLKHFFKNRLHHQNVNLYISFHCSVYYVCILQL